MIIRKLLIIFIVISTFLTESCSGSDNHASFTLKDNSATISVELSSMHPFLAEYKRFLILNVKGKEAARQKLFPDTGGYADANLYMCNKTTYMLKGYFDTWRIDINSGTITEGWCVESNYEYLGIFHGGGSEPWKFYTPSERNEVELVAGGG